MRRTTRSGRRAVALAAAAGALGAVLVSGLVRGWPAPDAASATGERTGGAAAAATPSTPSRSPVPAGEAGTPSAPRPTEAAGLGIALDAAEPTRVRIPALGVDEALVPLGLQEDGTMEVPPGARPAGWFTGGPTPGSLGPAVLAAHVTWNGKDGVFRHLADLAVGERVEVARVDGTTAVFEVTRIEQYPKARFPTEEVYGSVDHAGLRLITCGGAFDGDHYVDNVVAYARLVGSVPATGGLG